MDHDYSDDWINEQKEMNKTHFYYHQKSSLDIYSTTSDSTEVSTNELWDFQSTDYFFFTILKYFLFLGREI